MINGLILGMDFSEKETLFCRYDEATSDPVPVMAVKSGGREASPTSLALIPSKKRWVSGFEAELLVRNKEAVPVPYFFRKCRKNEEFRHDGNIFSAGEILAAYLRSMLLAADVDDPAQQVRALVLTVPKTCRELAGTVNRAFELLGLAGRAFLLDHSESFFYHTWQGTGMHKREAVLYHFSDEQKVSFLMIGPDSTAIPASVSVRSSEETVLPEEGEERDAAFARFVEKTLGSLECSGIFLVGDGFDRSWSKESLQLLCKGARKVYYGNNLFARGACFAALEKGGAVKPGDILFVGGDLVTDTIRMDLVAEGEPTEMTLIEAGIHWYEASAEIEFLLDEEPEIRLRAIDFRDGTVRKIKMGLPELPKRPERTTRIRLSIRYEDADFCVIRAEDLGFGELFPGTHRVWEEVLA